MAITPKIGAFVLETLTTGMYANPLDAVREYVQNAVDSIRAAEQQQRVPKGGGRIEIFADPKNRRLTIRDNGLGISRADAIRKLLDIGLSTKHIGSDAGFRGIGRLGGIAYCSSLAFRTSAVGERDVTTVVIDCAGMRSGMSTAMRGMDELAEVFARFTKVEYDACSLDEHFFEVVMDDILSNADEFLDWKRLEDYLCQTVPVEYDAHHFSYATVISNWIRKHGLSLPTVTLVIKTPEIERQVFKPYRTHYKTVKANGGGLELDVKGIEFYPENPQPDAPFWIWYGKTDLLGSIDDERVAGLRLRQHNIAIGGPERVAELFSEVASSNGRFNAWYIGEIHVNSPDAIPNARRDGFEDRDAWPSIKRDIIQFIKERCAEVRKTSGDRNRPTAKVMLKLDASIREAEEQIKYGIISKEHRDALLAKLKKNEEYANRVLEFRPASQESQEIRNALIRLQGLRSEVETRKEFAVANVRSSLDRKQRKVLQTVLETVRKTICSSQCNGRDECCRVLISAILAEFQVQERESEK